MGACREVEAQGLQLPRLEVPAVTPQEGLLETSNLERKPRAKDWARERDLGRWKAGRRQAQEPALSYTVLL